jgi:hypothetical protein
MLSQEDIGVDNVSTWEDTIEARFEQQDLKFEKMEAKMDKILEMVTRQASVNSMVYRRIAKTSILWTYLYSTCHSAL